MSRKLGFRRLAPRPSDGATARNVSANLRIAALFALLAPDERRRRRQQRQQVMAKRMLKHQGPVRGGHSFERLLSTQSSSAFASNGLLRTQWTPVEWRAIGRSAEPAHT